MCAVCTCTIRSHAESNGDLQVLQWSHLQWISQVNKNAKKSLKTSFRYLLAEVEVEEEEVEFADAAAEGGWSRELGSVERKRK